MMTEPSSILVVAAHADGRVYPETYDLVAFATQLQERVPANIRILVFGEDISPIAEEIARHTGRNVEAITCPGLAAYAGEAYRDLLVHELQQETAAYVCTLHNSQGLDFAPAVAAATDAACISGVNGLTDRDGRVLFQKYVYGGKIKANMAAHAPTTVLTVQPGVFKFGSESAETPGMVNHRQSTCRLERTRTLGTRQAEADTSNITEARVIVGAGNGVGEEENMEQIHKLAGLFPKSAVAGTRTVCDKGWLGYHQQVGVTGATVSPELYIACGISGAVQHVMGMQGSATVISINTDERAAIFNESDICIVEDLNQFIPVLLEVRNEQLKTDALVKSPTTGMDG